MKKFIKNIFYNRTVREFEYNQLGLNDRGKGINAYQLTLSYEEIREHK